MKKGNLGEQRDRLNILFICPFLPSLSLHAGGTRMYNIIQRLSKRHNIYLLSYSDNEEEKKFLPLLRSICQKVRIVERNPYNRRSGLFHPFRTSFSAEYGSPEMNKAIYEMLGASVFDIIQCEYIQMGYLLAKVRSRIVKGIKILTEHEVQFASLQNEIKNCPNHLNKVKLFLKWIKMLKTEISLCKYFKKIITLTEEDKISLHRIAPNLNISVISSGVDPDYFHPATEQGEEDNSLLYIGYFRHRPNVDAMLYFTREILPLIKREIKEIKLYIVGNTPPPEIQALEKDKNIIVTGWVEDIRPYLSQCRVYVAPIRLGAGIRSKILEAWSMQKAVVATPLGCAGLEAKHKENIWIAPDPGSFAQGIITLLKNRETRRRLGLNARKIVEKKYNWDDLTLEQEQIYYELRGVYASNISDHC